jgi:hypothetical protein
MALDLTALGKQVRQMSNELSSEPGARTERIERVRETYLRYAGCEEELIKMVNSSREANPWRTLASPYEQLDLVRDVPPAPADYALVATDGSQIELDRHGIVDCYLVNIGEVYLRYGGGPLARLSSSPTLYYREEDLYLTDGAKRVPIEGNYLSARRDVQELVALDALSAELLNGERAVLAMLDGTLVRWTLAGAERFVQEHFLRPYLDALESLRTHDVPVVSYISRPRATEVMGIVRLMYCGDVDMEQGRAARCNQCSDVRDGNAPSCNICDGLTDADVLAGLLQDGQRGALFISMSQINMKNYGPHLIHFFYMRVGRELARVEVPEWIAHDKARVDMVHSLVYDQCVRGQGYPVALSRAHEKAVVRTADRRAFQRMIESSLVRADMAALTSSKRESKEYSRV